jgi:gliding motility-associated-like protein
VFSIDPGKAKICIGDAVKISLRSSDNYLGDGWEWISGPGIADPGAAGIIVSPDVSTDYRIVAYDSVCQKRDTLTASVTVLPLPVVSVSKSNDIDCIYGEATLSVSGGIGYTWSPGSSLSDSLSSAPIARTGESTTYYVRVTDRNGCATTDSLRLNAVKDAGIGFPVANAFTPNGDGVNDCFGIKYWGYIGQFEFAVFDRWGQRVFYSQNPQDCWDGSYNGKRQPAGTYVYSIKAAALCGMAMKKGTVELIR